MREGCVEGKSFQLAEAFVLINDQWAVFVEVDDETCELNGEGGIVGHFKTVFGLLGYAVK